jgi:hypothetical protein
LDGFSFTKITVKVIAHFDRTCCCTFPAIIANIFIDVPRRFLYGDTEVSRFTFNFFQF